MKKLPIILLCLIVLCACERKGKHQTADLDYLAQYRDTLVGRFNGTDIDTLETKDLIKKLPNQINEWCKARQPWEEEMCTDWLSPEYPRHTAEVLVKLANIISSAQ